MKVPRVLLLTDRSQLPAGRDLVSTVAACAEAGLEVVVLRELDLSEDHRQRLAHALGSTGVAVISARTRLDGVAGVHLASAQPPPGEEAALPHGRSCHDAAEIRAAVRDGASYVTISPVAASASKPGYGPALGLPGVRRAVRLAGSVPVLALGGVGARNAAALRTAGAHGVAVMGAVMRADDPGDTFRQIAQAVR
ncbi:thiamine phosphate synthase [Nocardioides pyridinolyticus]